MRKKMILEGILAIMICAGVICLSAGVSLADDFMNCWSESYFEQHPLTVQELTARYGQPSAIIDFHLLAQNGQSSKIIDQQGGEKDYVYKKFEKDPMLESTRHFIIKDGKVMKSFLKN
ncbi:MAG: hypothetical protein HY881_22100 [Deltaproteobacteria bacterium]|nr:hypothetical protein [Deltaproteobacteria bacterium]